MKMNNSEVKFKECYVLLEPCTPKPQLTLSAELRNVINERNMLTSHTRKKFISDLDEITYTEIESKRQTRKNKAIQEILDSEVVYLKQLEIIMNFFMKPIRTKGILNEHVYEILFGSIENIYKVNGELLNELKENLMNVATAFSKLAPFFKMYSVYAYDYKKCLDMLEKLYETNPKFTTLLVNQESRPEVQAKLSSLLITPIQRIPRYCMLLKQVLENTLPTEPDYIVLKDSLEKLEEVARHVDSLVEDRENSQRLLELLRCLKNGKTLIIQPGRKLIKEGILCQKTPTHPNIKIYLVLMSDIIMCCKIKKSNISSPNSLKCQTIYPLNRCKIDQNNKTKMFEITCQNESLVLYHEKGSESQEWIKVLHQSVLKCIKNRSTLRKGSSSRRPVGKDNLTPYMDPGLSPGISRIRKRRRTEDEVDKIEAKKVLKLEEANNSLLRCLPNLTRRKSIASFESKERVKDSLFPLRHHFENNEIEPENNIIEPEEIVQKENETLNNVYIFGANHNENHNGFSFRLSSFFSGISNTFKRALGFK